MTGKFLYDVLKTRFCLILVRFHCAEKIMYVTSVHLQDYEVDIGISGYTAEELKSYLVDLVERIC